MSITDTTTQTKRSSILHAWPALLVLLAGCFRLASPDVPLGMAWGRAIVERGALPETNIFSHMNPDRIVLLDKWLFQVTTYLIHAITGPWGLIALRIALLVVALLAIAKAVRIRWQWTPHALLAVGMAIALMNRCYVRAELVTWAAIPLTLCLVPGIAAGKKRAWMLLVLLQALWANAHGYWVVGPMLWAAIAAGAAFHVLLTRKGFGERDATRPPKARRRLLIAAPVALAAACLTPYGIRTVAHPVRLALELQKNDILKRAVDDFGTPLEAIRRGGTIPFWACCAMAIAGILAAVWLARHRRLEGEKLALLGLGLVLGLPYYRNMTIMALCAMPMAVDAIRIWRDGRDKPIQPWRYAVAALPAALWLGAAFSGSPQATDYGARQLGFGWNLDRYPIAPADWVARNAPDAKLWNDLGVGGWLNLRLGEGQTYIDGNTDGYPLKFLEQYDAQFNGTDVAPWLNAQNGCTVALIDYGGDDQTLAKFLRGVSWFETPAFGYADDRYCVLFASPDAPGADPKLSRSFWQSIIARVNANAALAEGHSVALLTSVPPSAPNNMYARSGRLVHWLYPNDPAAQAHYTRTRRAQ